MSTSVRRSLFITTGQRYASLGTNFLTLAIVSRLLSPMEIGIAVLGIAATSIGEAVRDFGATNYLIQRDDLTPTSVRTAFTVTFIFAVAIGLTIILAAPAIAAFYGEPKLIDVLRLIASTFLVYPFSGMIMALMLREMDFTGLAVISVASQVSGGVVTIACSVKGFAHMSFAWGALATAVMLVAFSLFSKPHFWVFRPSLAEWRSVLRFGALSSSSMLVEQAFSTLPTLALGRFATMASVGSYSRAQTICQLSDKLVMTSVLSVALPALLREKRNGRCLKNAYLKSLCYITGVYWPINVLLALLAYPIVGLLLGPQWLSVVPLVQVMSVATLMAYPSGLTYPILVAADGVADVLYSRLSSFVMCGIIVCLAAARGPLILAYSLLLVVPLQVAVSLCLVRKRIGFGWKEFFGATRSSVVVTLATVVPAAFVVLMLGRGSLQVGLGVGALAAASAAAAWLVTIIAVDHPLNSEVNIALSYLRRRLAQARVW
jgi:O-antigen/teichoic acid export membrane protein